LTSHIKIPGLILVNDFVSVQEEAELVKILTGPSVHWAVQERPSGGVVRRRVQHYGYVFDYKTSDVLRAETGLCPPMPADKTSQASCHQIQGAEDRGKDRHRQCAEGSFDEGWSMLGSVTSRLRSYAPLVQNVNQITVNEYPPSVGIGSHVDTPSAFADGICSVSLGGDVVMEFREVKTTNDGFNIETGVKKQVFLPRRSLLIMSGDSRYCWEHSIASRMTDTVEGVVRRREKRVSITYRTAISLQGQPLTPLETLDFPPRTVGGRKGGEVENRHANDMEVTVKESGDPLITPEEERKHVHQVYDAIAEQCK